MVNEMSVCSKSLGGKCFFPSGFEGKLNHAKFSHISLVCSPIYMLILSHTCKLKLHPFQWYFSQPTGEDIMLFTGYSLGRDKLDQLLRQGRLSKDEINSTYKIMRRIEAEELSLDASEIVITSTRQEIEEQWRLYDGFDPILERKLRARIRRNVSCYGRFTPRMADDNRYNASRGAHLNLKRAEKARILVNKIPAIVDSLVAKTGAWEQDRDTTFTYDGVPLLAMLDEYMMLRHDREEEKRRLRDQKKFHEQVSKEQEPTVGSPSPARPTGTKKVVGPRPNGSANGTTGRRLS